MPLDSSNNGYNPTPQLQQVLASPDIQGTRQRDDVNNSKSYQLAKQLGALQPEIQNIQGDIAQSDKERATADVNSMSTEAYAQHLKDNPTQLTQSPVYNAMASRVNAQNIASNTQQGILQKIASGEQTFADDPLKDKYDANGTQNPNWISGNQRLTAYLHGARAHDLQGQDVYAVAGYDSTWQQFVQKATNNNAEVLAAQSLAWSSQASENRLTNLMANASPEQIPALVAQFRDETQQPAGTLFNKKAASVAYESQALKWADAGNAKKVEALLNTQLDDGVSISKSMGTNPMTGEKNGERLINHARLVEAQNTLKADKEARVQKALDINTSVINNITQQMRSGMGTSVPTMVPKATAEDVTDQPSEPLKQKIALGETQGMSQQDKFNYYDKNTLIDPNLKLSITAAAYSNVDSNVPNADGSEKLAGQVTGASLQGIKDGLFVLHQKEGYTKLGQYATPEVVSRLVATDALMTTGLMTVDKAAGIMAMKDGSPDKWAAAEKKANTLVANLGEGWISRQFSGNEPLTGNLNKVQESIKVTASALAAAGLGDKVITDALTDVVQKSWTNINGYATPITALPMTGQEQFLTGGAPAAIKAFSDATILQLSKEDDINPNRISLMIAPDSSVMRFMLDDMPYSFKSGSFVVTPDKYSQWVKENISSINQGTLLNSERLAFKNHLIDQMTYKDGAYDAKGNRRQLSPNDAWLSSITGYNELTNNNLSKTSQLAFHNSDEFSVDGIPLIAPTTKEELAAHANTKLPKTAEELYKRQQEFATQAIANGKSPLDNGIKLPKEPLPDLRDIQVDPKTQDASKWGKRQDGTDKGAGFLGVLRRPDGGVSTELSISTEALNGRDFPLLVPTLTTDEVKKVLAIPMGDKNFVKKLPKGVIDKAEKFAEKRDRQGKPLFALKNESPAFTGGQ